jgi:hypothetical protein
MNLGDILTKTSGRIIIGTFSSLLSRIKQTIEMCEKLGKVVALGGFSMRTNVEIAKELGYMQFNPKTLIDLKNINKYPDDKVVIICTGAQGEKNASLMRIANGEHRDVTLKKGDTVIFSSSVIPGNERTVQRLMEMKELVEVLLVETRLVAKRSVEVLRVVTRLVAVAFTAVRLVVDALVMYPLVAVIPVPEAVVKVVCPVTLSVPPTTTLPEAVTLVADALVRVVCPVTVRVEAVVVAKVEVPVTTKVPVVVALVVKRLETTALVVVELPTTRLVMFARVATSEEMNPLVVVLLVAVKLVIVALVVVELPTMRSVI